MEKKNAKMKVEMRDYRTLFISDVHLGSKGCQAHLLLDFLKHNRADTIYLVGDIVDGWRLKKNWYWPQAHNDVVQKLLRASRKGTKVVYLPGNHDEFLRDYLRMQFGDVVIEDQVIHETADKRRFLVMHGDQFDVVVRHHKWLAILGDGAYMFAIKVNTILNKVRRKLGLSYWSLSAWAKMKVKSAVNFVGEFEKALCSEADRNNVDGIICGHIHHAVMHSDYGIEYVNTGDWVESCTAVGELEDGTLEIVKWTELSADIAGAANETADNAIEINNNAAA